MNPPRFHIAVRRHCGTGAGYAFLWQLEVDPSGEPFLWDEETALNQAYDLMNEHGRDNVKILRICEMVIPGFGEPRLR
jgi:hypothetical protein